MRTLRRFWRWFKAPPTSRQVGWWLVIAMACEITFVLTDEPWWFACNTMGLALSVWWMPDAHDRKWRRRLRNSATRDTMKL